MDESSSHYPPPDQSYASGAYPAATDAPQNSASAAVDHLQLTAALEQGSFPSQLEHIANFQNESPRSYREANGGYGDADQQADGGASGPMDDSPLKPRLRKACDACSVRKVKCDETGPPCRACRNLEIPCTFNRPSRRRGPPNRHAEAIKRRRIDFTDPIGSSSSPSSPTHAAQALAALSAAPVANAESIAQMDVVERLLQDFFLYVHPVAPFPHEITFMQSVQRRDDIHNKFFTALIAAMVGCLAAGYPQRVRASFRACGKTDLMISPRKFADHCLAVSTASRGPAYLDRPEINIYDATTSYFIGQIYALSSRPKPARRYLAEAMLIVRNAELDRNPESRRSYETVDLITQELGRRLYWTMFADVKTMLELGDVCNEVTFPTPSNSEPSLPVETDDVYIYHADTHPQPAGITAECTGFNSFIRVLQSILPATDFEAISQPDIDARKGKALVKQCLDVCKAIPTLPESLKDATQQLQDFLNNHLNEQSGQAQSSLPDDKKAVQTAVQKATLDASSITTRLFLVGMFWRLKHTNMNSDDDEEAQQLAADMKAERVSICKDVIQLLARSGQMQFENETTKFMAKIGFVLDSLMKHVPDEIGRVSSEDSQLLSRCRSWMTKAVKASREQDDGSALGDGPGTVMGTLWAEWLEIQGSISIT